jgi:ferrous iron transport protein B
VSAATDIAARRIAIIGNPNAGKTSIFNALTGLHQKVANYPGVTVEKKEGRIAFDDGSSATLVDLPGTYSLHANSPDEKVATDVLLGRRSDTPPPDLVLCVVDASNLERNLYFVTQIIDCGLPVVVALNMMDIAERDGITIDTKKLAEMLGVAVVPMVASKGTGVTELRAASARRTVVSPRARQWSLPAAVHEEYDELRRMIQQECRVSEPLAYHEAATLLTSPGGLQDHAERFPQSILSHAAQDHQKLEGLGYDCQSLFIEARYEWINRISAASVLKRGIDQVSFTDKLDRILTHKVWGLLVFLAVMSVIFHTIFSWANIPMELIGDLFAWIGTKVVAIVPPGDLQNLIVQGALAGVGAVVTFLPQIMFLFLFLGLLEDTGYMARAAFLMDNIMRKVGLHGKSFIPLLSSFACAIPGIMATRTIESRKDRIVTMLVVPLIGCSARLPVYTLLIAAFIPAKKVLGIFSLPGLTLISMYILGLVSALGMAWLFKKTLLKGEVPVFIMELPPYKLPSLRSVLLQMWERSFQFLKSAGTIILGVSIILWFLASYPKIDHGTSAEQLEKSFAGQAGRLIEPAIKPLGFDWKIGIGLIGSILQREVFVSTMGTIYNIQDADKGEGNVSLLERLHSDVDPVTGMPTFTVLTAVCLMIYYVLAMQCMSTVAVVRRETNGWRWPLFQIAYMTALAYAVTFLVYRAGLMITG